MPAADLFAFGESSRPVKPKRTKQSVGIIIGALLLIISPIVAHQLYISGIGRAYETLGAPGVADPARLSSNIDSVLYACAGGLAGSLIGLVILILSISRFVNAGRQHSSAQAVA